MSKLELDTVLNANSLATINANFQKIEQELQDKVLYRDNPVGEPNTVEQDIDLNGKKLLNAGGLSLEGVEFAPVSVVEGYLNDAEASAIAASNSASAALTSKNAAETAETNAETALSAMQTLLATTPGILLSTGTALGSSGTITIPAGARFVEVEMQAPGGAAGSVPSPGAGQRVGSSGGGGGAYARFLVAVDPAVLSTISFTKGTAGAIVPTTNGGDATGNTTLSWSSGVNPWSVTLSGGQGGKTSFTHGDSTVFSILGGTGGTFSRTGTFLEFLGRNGDNGQPYFSFNSSLAIAGKGGASPLGQPGQPAAYLSLSGSFSASVGSGTGFGFGGSGTYSNNGSPAAQGTPGGDAQIVYRFYTTVSVSL